MNDKNTKFHTILRYPQVTVKITDDYGTDGEIFIHCNLCKQLIIHYEGHLARAFINPSCSQAKNHKC